METNLNGNILETTFYNKINIPDDIRGLMIQGEEPHSAYKTWRDTAVFTNKRLIVKDAQGIRGKKIEVYSIPYSTIHMWSSENASGFLDFTAEIELWTKAGKIKINLQKGIDIRELDNLISRAVLS